MTTEPTREEIEAAYWRAMEAGILPRPRSGYVAEAFEVGYRAAREVRSEATIRADEDVRMRQEHAWREGYYTGKRDYVGSVTGGVPISTPNPYRADAIEGGGQR